MVSFMEAAAKTISSTGSACSVWGSSIWVVSGTVSFWPQAVSASTRESARSRDTSLFMGFFFLSK